MRPRYRIDNSGLYHRAILRKDRSNIFRLCVKLNVAVEPITLQKALDAVTPRFPTMVAAIRGNYFHYYAIPVNTPPVIQREIYPLSYMSRAEIRRCALRVLYDDNSIAVEFFHSLTDGHGGIIFLKSLLAEYLRLSHSISIPQDDEVLRIADAPHADETEESFLKYAGKSKAPFDRKTAYLPGSELPSTAPCFTTVLFDTDLLLATAKSYGVSLTVFLTAALAKSIMTLQTNESADADLPVQIMLPVDLRRRFESRTLRNFTLYALPFIEPSDLDRPFEALIQKINTQLKEQLTSERLKAMMTTNIGLEYNWFLRKLPLMIKCLGLKIGFILIGARNSSLSLSNLGEVSFPPPISDYVEDVSFYLSPRIYSPYNCTALSCNGKLRFTFTGNETPLLEPEFVKTMETLGCKAENIINKNSLS